MKRLLSTLIVLTFAIVTAQAQFGVHAYDIEQKGDNNTLQDPKDSQENILSRAVANRDVWQERASWSYRMYRLGYVSKAQVDADQAKLESAEETLKKLQQIEKAPKGGDQKQVKPDPQATKLLADARAARAEWTNFPGFTADAEVNFDGKISRGKAIVEKTGKVTFEKLDPEAESWARRQLSSVVAHRLDDAASLKTPCAFADTNVNHPLGRAITVLSDELHSSYRIRDRQIIVVNREMKNFKFSITVLENRTNKEGKFLPASYVVHYWETESGVLQRTESHSQTWTRIGNFDLPGIAYVITATKSLSTRSLTLSNHQLSK